MRAGSGIGTAREKASHEETASGRVPESANSLQQLHEASVSDDSQTAI